MKNDFRSIQDVWKKLMFILTAQQKRIGIVVLLMSVVGALFEMLGVSIIIPLIQALLNPEQLMNNRIIAYFTSLLSINDSEGMVVLVCVAVIIVYIIKNIYLTCLSWVRARYACKIMRELSTTVMKSYMERDYSFFIDTDTSTLLRDTFNDPEGVYYVIYNGFRIVAEGLTVLCICIFIIGTDAYMAVCMIALGLLCIFIMLFGFRGMMRENGILYRKYNADIYQQINQSYQGIKEIMVMGRQKFFTDRYEEAYKKKQKCYVDQIVASESPAFIIEAICVVGIIITIAIRVMNISDAVDYVPKLASFALAAFRIMPSLGKISSAANVFIYNCPSLSAAYLCIQEVRKNHDSSFQNKHENRNENGSKFHSSIDIENIAYTYPNSQQEVLKNVTMNIRRGTSIGIIGSSGAGKSTLMDIILGLLHPQSGSVKVDGISIRDMADVWGKMIGYVPQTIYMTDDTIRNNIAFGLPEQEIDDSLVWNAIRSASLEKYVTELPERLDTIVGERGIHLSGGQRQRIAIARALYYDPPILVFDEATSALDNVTEQEIMAAVENLHGKKTIIIVAHRLSTIKNCDEIYEVHNGNVVKKRKEEFFF